LSTAEIWTNTSFPPPCGAINPYPFCELNHFTVPRAIPDLPCWRCTISLEIPADNGLGGGAAWEEFTEQELTSTLLADDANREAEVVAGFPMDDYCRVRRSVKLVRFSLRGIASLVLFPML